jgi:hypothetical protein
MSSKLLSLIYVLGGLGTAFSVISPCIGSPVLRIPSDGDGANRQAVAAISVYYFARLVYNKK